MVRTLQRKFIVAAMLAVTLVMVLFLAALNVLNYFSMNRDAERMLRAILVANMRDTPDGIGRPDGTPPELPPGDDALSSSQAGDDIVSSKNSEGGTGADSDQAGDDTASSENAGDGTETEQPGGMDGNPPDKPADERDEDLEGQQYFFVRLSEDGSMIYEELSHAAGMDSDKAKSYISQVQSGNQVTGQVDGYLYRCQTDEMSRGRVIAFLDARQQTRSFLRTLALTLAVGAVSWILVLLLVILLSRRAIRPVAESIEKQKRFITDAGHEIKTPLAIIQANADALELYTGENKWLTNIRGQISRLSTLTANLLTLSKMEEGTERALISETFDAAALLRQTAESFREEAAKRGISLHTETEETLTVSFPKEIYVRLLSILLENAVKYADENGRIRAGLSGKARHMTLTVENDCSSLPDCEPDRLFDRFYRADAARTQKSGGSGIGLSTARALAEGTGGSIRAEYGEGVIRFIAQL